MGGQCALQLDYDKKNEIISIKQMSFNPPYQSKSRLTLQIAAKIHTSVMLSLSKMYERILTPALMYASGNIIIATQMATTAVIAWKVFLNPSI